MHMASSPRSSYPQRRTLLAMCMASAATGAVAAVTPSAARPARSARSWPLSEVQMTVPFPVGGTSAALAKALQRPFEALTSQTLRLQYFGGAGGMQGALHAAAAPTNGYHLLMGGSYLSLSRVLHPNEDFDFLQDLQPLAMVAQVPQVLLVNPQRLRVRHITELLNELARKPARYRMATASVGSTGHLMAALFKQQTTSSFEFVHFRGAGPALQDLVAGSVDMMVDGLVSCLPHLRSGKLKALLVSGTERCAILPDVPCAQEMALTALEYNTWYGLFAPKKIAPATAAKVVEQLEIVGQSAQLKAEFQRLGVQWAGIAGARFETLVAQQVQQSARQLQSLGVDQTTVKNLKQD